MTRPANHRIETLRDHVGHDFGCSTPRLIDQPRIDYFADCTGLDHDDFIDPGAAIEIRFERLGSLRCRFAAPRAKPMPSRWPVRPPVQPFHA